MKLEDHRTVRRIDARTTPSVSPKHEPLDAGRLKQLVLDAGADDVGFVEIGRPALDEQRQDILQAFPHTRTLISFVVRMNREAIRTPARSVSNLEFHHSGDEVNDIARSVVRTLEDRGIRAMNPAMGFPMEMDRFPGKVWAVSHKPVAVAAGLGMMGIHRNVIHEKFGNFILLGTILLDAEVSESSQPIDYNPCLECKLCVAACPVGAISSEGDFNFSACYTHNYREFMGGFTDWVEQVKHVGNSLRPSTIAVFLGGMPNVFQPGKSAGLNATFHFTFTGQEQRQATVVIREQKISVKEGHVGQPDLHVIADSQTWIGFLRKEKNVVWALLRRKIRLTGPLKLLAAFGKCFPQ